MDQMKTGTFIADERKRKQYTQRQLADRLGISDKTVSKWERGNGFPEISLLLPLCRELEITVNELLSGERLADADYKQKAEENMVSVMKEAEENKKKMHLTFLVGAISFVAFFTIIMVVALYTEAIDLPAKIILLVIACAILAVGFCVAMQGERTIGYYKCKCCGHTFVPGFASYMMGMHMWTTRHLKCPQCGKKSWCKKVYSKE